MKKTLVFVISFILLPVLLSSLLSLCGGKNSQNEVHTQPEVEKTEENTGKNSVEEIDTVFNKTSAIENDDVSVPNDNFLDIYGLTEEQIDKAAATIIEMVKNRDKKGISKIIHYPLEREYPIPSIKNETEFIERFDEIFDAKLINKIKNISPKDWGAFGWRGIYFTENKDNDTHLFLNFGADSEGNIRIFSIEDSEIEAKKAKSLIEFERKELHESLKSFLYPVVLVETPTHLIRIDCIEEKDTIIGNQERSIGYRYASWKKGSSISEKPDLILTNGVEFVDGSEGHTTYEFINGNYGYSCGVGMWGNPQYLEHFGIYKNVKVDEEGRINCNDNIILWEDNSGGRSEIQLVYWSERSKLK